MINQQKLKRSSHPGLLILVFSLICFLSFPNTSQAQGKIEIAPFVGYSLNGTAKFIEGKIHFKDAINYGIAMDVALGHGTKVQLAWSYTSTTAEFRPYTAFDFLDKDFNVKMNYLQLGAIREVDRGGNAIPYGLFSMGIAWLNPDDNNIESVTRMAIALGGGVKVWLSDRVGIKLQARLLAPMYFSGGGIYYGIGSGGSGGGLSVNTTTTVIQADFTGGFIFALGN